MARRRAPRTGAGRAPETPTTWAGLAWALLAVSIWAGWFTVTAYGVRSELTASDVALIRVVVPALLLAPLLVRERARLARLGWYDVAGVALYGVPFVMLVATGLQFAPISHAAALIPGLMPVFMGILGAWLLAERLTPRRLGGFALMVGAAILIGHQAGVLTGQAGELWVGHACFLAAGAAWSIFTLTTRRLALDPFVATGLVGLISTTLFLPTYLALGLGKLTVAGWGDIALQVVAQGLLAGFVAVYAYAKAIRLLGASSAAACAALVPGSAALIGWAVLAERPSVTEGIAMALAGLGVYLASGARLKA